MNILFIGNSHTYAFGMPYQVRELLNNSSDIDHHVSMVTTGGKSLGWHAEAKGTRLNVLCNQWDHIFLQQATHPFAEKKSHENDFKAMSDLLKDSGAKITFCMTWARKDEPGNQTKIDEVYSALTDKMNWSKLPISKIWHKIINEYPAIDLYMPDNSHASSAGAYLVACACYAHIAGNKTVGLPQRIVSGGEDFVDLTNSECLIIQAAVDAELSCLLQKGV